MIRVRKPFSLKPFAGSVPPQKKGPKGMTDVAVFTAEEKSLAPRRF